MKQLPGFFLTAVLILDFLFPVLHSGRRILPSTKCFVFHQDDIHPQLGHSVFSCFFLFLLQGEFIFFCFLISFWCGGHGIAIPGAKVLKGEYCQLNCIVEDYWNCFGAAKIDCDGLYNSGFSHYFWGFERPALQALLEYLQHRQELSWSLFDFVVHFYHDVTLCYYIFLEETCKARDSWVEADQHMIPEHYLTAELWSWQDDFYVLFIQHEHNNFLYPLPISSISFPVHIVIFIFAFSFIKLVGQEWLSFICVFALTLPVHYDKTTSWAFREYGFCFRVRELFLNQTCAVLFLSCYIYYQHRNRAV